MEQPGPPRGSLEEAWGSPGQGGHLGQFKESLGWPVSLALAVGMTSHSDGNKGH